MCWYLIAFRKKYSNRYVCEIVILLIFKININILYIISTHILLICMYYWYLIRILLDTLLYKYIIVIYRSKILILNKYEYITQLFVQIKLRLTTIINFIKLKLPVTNNLINVNAMCTLCMIYKKKIEWYTCIVKHNIIIMYLILYT